MGHRRGWLLFTQLMIIASLILTSLTDPAKSLLFITISITLLAIFSSTQDILIDAFRIESNLNLYSNFEKDISQAGLAQDSNASITLSYNW